MTPGEREEMSEYLWECYEASLYAAPRPAHWWPLGDEPPESFDRPGPGEQR